MESNVTLRKSLTMFQAAFLGLAWMTPMIYFSVFGIAYDASQGSITEAYVLALVAIVFTAVSYSILSGIFPTSGSAYTYVKQAIHPYLGFLVGWAIMLDYLFSPLIAYLTFGIFLHAQFPAVPSFVWIVLLNVLVALVNIVGIKVSALVSKLFVLIQICFIVLVCFLLVRTLMGQPAAILPFADWSSHYSTALAGASIICFSFLGFDVVTTMAEETKDAKKNIPRAVMLIIIVAGILYISLSMLIQMVFPSLSFANLDAAGFELIKQIGGAALGLMFIMVMILAIFTQGLTSITSVSRLLFVFGRDAILPKRFFGRLSAKFLTPVNNIVLVSVLSLFALSISLDMAVKFVSFGSLVSFVFVNVCVIVECYFKRKMRSLPQTFLYFIFPLLGAVFICWLLSLLDSHALRLGFAWMAAGVIYHAYRTKLSKGWLKQSLLDAREQRRQMVLRAMMADD
ncbi:APC family permease [Paenibacillus aestuarii]|uniref:APC family permease n=1 Tax=Paenibacillus aestuarii TaxID=516965 RepID=A0ABW0K7R6_9BACL|nr:APC family permease [Paenibacillus aestuarii]